MAYESPESAAAFWREHGVTEPPRLAKLGKFSRGGAVFTPARRQKHVASTLAALHGSPAPESPVDDEDASWDMWDTPMRSPLPVLTPAVRRQQQQQTRPEREGSPSAGSFTSGTSSSHNSVGDGSELSSRLGSTLPSTTPGSPASVTAKVPVPDGGESSSPAEGRDNSAAWQALRKMSGERVRAGILADWERGLGIAGGSGV
jgi:hypothetical protein